MRIVIIEDSIPVQNMLADALSPLPGLEISGVADTCGPALDLVRTHQPEIVTLDLTLKDGSSIPYIPKLLAARPGLKLIVFSLNIDPIIRTKVLQSGAAHCFDKTLGADPIVEAVRAGTMTTSI
ncbi:MAG: response regulator [Bryobacteraceae bacterium]